MSDELFISINSDEEKPLPKRRRARILPALIFLVCLFFNSIPTLLVRARPPRGSAG